MTLRAAIQIPVQRITSLDIVLDVMRALARQFFTKGLENPFGFQLTPVGDHFLAEILVPLGSRAEIERALEILVLVNLIYRRAHPSEPVLYKAGVRYREPGKLAWYSLPILYDKKRGDCKDLSAARVAELREQGEEGARCHLVRQSPRLWHVQVKRANGTIEDPSARLGMRRVLQRIREQREVELMRRR